MNKLTKQFRAAKRWLYPSPAEKKFLRVMGFWFFIKHPVKREYPLAGYYIDFAIPTKRIAIEIDGKQFHGGKRDIIRDMTISSHHWHTLRIPAADLWRHPNLVRRQVKLFVQNPYKWRKKYGSQLPNESKSA